MGGLRETLTEACGRIYFASVKVAWIDSGVGHGLVTGPKEMPGGRVGETCLVIWRLFELVEPKEVGKVLRVVH